MSREITQRELRNESGAVMRGLDDGETYIVTRNGTPVGELAPIRRRRFVRADAVLAAFAGAARIEPGRFRRDMAAEIDEGATPRA
jgi:antitoxin (DNA-binding transcriptional repressor) of toxin-antitoxin stability system